MFRMLTRNTNLTEYSILQFQDELQQHELNHNASQVACHLCNKIFANIYRLQRHMLSHEIDPQTRKFKCSHCSKAFKFKHHLKVLKKTKKKKSIHWHQCWFLLFLGTYSYSYR